MRDFLIEKLRSAELAIKASMAESLSLKKQISSHEEVGICYYFSCSPL